MDFHFQQRQTKSRLPSFGITVLAHLALLALVMQARQHYASPSHPVDAFPVPLPKISEPEPEVRKTNQLPPPASDPFIAPPEIEIAIPTEPPPTIFRGTNIRPPEVVFESGPGGGVVGTPPRVTPHTPVHINASVDAKACEKPAYPPSAQRLGEEGVVSLSMLIGADGQVLQSKVDQSSGSRELDNAAIRGLRLCKFKPGTLDGVAEKGWTHLQYAWTLNE